MHDYRKFKVSVNGRIRRTARLSERLRRYVTPQIRLTGNAAAGQHLQRRRHGPAPAGRAQCGREQRGHPRRLAYSSRVAQRYAQFAFLCGFSLRITDVSNAFVRSSADSTPGGQRQSYLASTSSKPSSLKADLSNVSVRVQPALAPSAPMSASANEPLPSLSAIVA